MLNVLGKINLQYNTIQFITRTAWAVFKYCGTKTAPLRR
jgi:hypothetical protein